MRDQIWDARCFALIGALPAVRCRIWGLQAGYKTVYEHGFTFATVKGAGHMVPQYQPQRALDLFSSWITTKQLPAAAPPPVDTLPSQKVR